MSEKVYRLMTEISDLKALLEKDGDTGWCLGDPYEALTELERQLSVEVEKQ